MNYACVTDLQRIKDYLQGAPVVAFDFETSPLLQYREDNRAALDAHRACIVGISRVDAHCLCGPIKTDCGISAGYVVLHIC